MLYELHADINGTHSASYQTVAEDALREDRTGL
ncbi:hypothetical protein LEAN103870_09030 [Legionella anisa]